MARSTLWKTPYGNKTFVLLSYLHKYTTRGWQESTLYIHLCKLRRSFISIKSLLTLTSKIPKYLYLWFHSPTKIFSDSTTYGAVSERKHAVEAWRGKAHGKWKL